MVLSFMIQGIGFIVQGCQAFSLQGFRVLSLGFFRDFDLLVFVHKVQGLGFFRVKDLCFSVYCLIFLMFREQVFLFIVLVLGFLDLGFKIFFILAFSFWVQGLIFQVFRVYHFFVGVYGQGLRQCFLVQSLVFQGLDDRVGVLFCLGF